VRFPKELIGSIRRGELTVLRRPVNNRPCPFKSGRFYVLEKVEDRHEHLCPECSGDGCEECGDHGTFVTYEKRATTLDDEYIEITEVARQPLHWADDKEAQSWGFETREDYISDWQERNRSTVDTYVVRFTYATDMPNLLAKVSGYTHSDFDAVPMEPEAVDKATAEHFAKHAQERHEARQEERKLSEWVAELENDPTTSAHQLASVRKRLEQIEKRRRRRVA
jgi:hypothetical protein